MRASHRSAAPSGTGCRPSSPRVSLLKSHAGQRHDGLGTGRIDSNTWVRTVTLPVEGKLVGRIPELAIVPRVQVKLLATDVAGRFTDSVLLNRTSRARPDWRVRWS
jgi:hypothetical protein